MKVRHFAACRRVSGVLICRRLLRPDQRWLTCSVEHVSVPRQERPLASRYGVVVGAAPDGVEFQRLRSPGRAPKALWWRCYDSVLIGSSTARQRWLLGASPRMDNSRSVAVAVDPIH